MDTKRICQSCGTPLSTDAPEGLCPQCLLKIAIGSQTGASGGASKRKPAPAPEEIAKHFPQLEILEFVGQGGMGAVYKARQKQLDRIVALKILPPGIGDDPAFAERFAREARALAKLNHPGIVTLYEFGSAAVPAAPVASGSQPSALNSQLLYYFLMEFVDGVNLRQLLNAGRVSPREALAIVPQICDALQFAHDQGIVHRDIKPENVLLDRRGRVKVADFGLAKLIGTDALTPSLSHPMGEGGTPVPGEGSSVLTEAGKVMGTPSYMAPEQREHPSEVDHRADIYALGVVFYQMLTGELPGKRIEPPSNKVLIDVRLDEIVLRALERQPELRYQQASVLKTEVEAIAQTESRKAESEKEGQRRLTGFQILFRSVVVGAGVWLLLFALAAAATSLLPRIYEGTARVKLFEDGSAQHYDPHLLQNEFTRLESPDFLKQVGAAADLKTRWKDSLDGGETQQAEQMASRLRQAMDLRPIRNTDIIEIRYHSEFPGEAADVANAIATVYCGQTRAVFIDRAAVPMHPTRPNPFWNLAVGVFGGGLVGLVAGGLTALYLAFRKPRASGGSPRMGGQPAPSETQSGQTPAAVKPRYGILALAFLAAGTLGTLALMTLSPRHELALIFGGVALLLAFVFGLMGWSERSGKFAVITLGALLGVGVMLAVISVGIYFVRGPQVRSEMERQLIAEKNRLAVAVEQANAQEYSFGPVIERTLEWPDAGRVRFLNFERAELLEAPPEITRLLASPDWVDRYGEEDNDMTQMQAWVRRSGADLVARNDGEGFILFDGWSVASHPDSGIQNGDEEWNMTAPEAVQLMNDFEKRVGKRVVLPSLVDSTMRIITKEFPKSFLFKTRESSIGVLQMTAFGDDLRSLNIRYKLVQTPSSRSTVQSNDLEAFTFIRSGVDPCLIALHDAIRSGDTTNALRWHAKLMQAVNDYTSRYGKADVALPAQAVQMLNETGAMLHEGKLEQARRFLDAAERAFTPEWAAKFGNVADEGKTGEAKTRVQANAATSAELEFRLVAEEGDTHTPADDLNEPGDRTGRAKLRVLKEVLLDSSAVASARLSTSVAQSQLQSDVKEISVILKPDAARRFADITADNLGRRLAIIWRGRVLSAPVVRSQISNGTLVITGNLSDAETLVLLDLLNFQTRTEVVESREDQLTAAVARLRDLRLKYTDAHPLVVEQLEIIEQLKNP